MKKILIIGAGRSSTILIDYLLKHAESCNWQITVADADITLAQSKIANHPRGKAMALDILNISERKKAVQSHDFVVSMLPAFMHGEVAKDCVECGVSMATASYVSDTMKALDKEAQKKGIILLNELGLDPGIDHASAMKIIHDIKSKGGKIISFYSYCGGLVAPESNDNPWGYKISWNPRNVVMAGTGVAQYLSEGKIKYLPYPRLFSAHQTINIESHTFDAYANRNSLEYIDIYGIPEVKNLLRGTLRYSGYCKAWDIIVNLGLTDDSFIIPNTSAFTYKQWTESFLIPGNESVIVKLKKMFSEKITDEVLQKLEYLGLFSDNIISIKNGTPAQVLQTLMEEKLKLKEHDKDRVVMYHLFEYEINGKKYKLESYFDRKGHDSVHTAMAETVGLPLAITVKNYLTKKFNLTGVQIPTIADIYNPLLEELKEHNIRFIEKIYNH